MGKKLCFLITQGNLWKIPKNGCSPQNGNSHFLHHRFRRWYWNLYLAILLSPCLENTGEESSVWFHMLPKCLSSDLHWPMAVFNSPRKNEKDKVDSCLHKHVGVRLPTVLSQKKLFFVLRCDLLAFLWLKCPGIY